MSTGQCSASTYIQNVALLQSLSDAEIIATMINRPFYNSMLIICTVQRQAFLLNSHAGLEQDDFFLLFAWDNKRKHKITFNSQQRDLIL